MRKILDTTSQRQPIEQGIARIDAQITGLKAERRKFLAADAIEENKAQCERLFAQRNELLDRLRSMYQPDDDYRRNYAAYQRRRSAEERLVDALCREQVHAHYGIRGHYVQTHLWRGTDGFRYCLDLSLGIMPSRFGARRRDALFFAKGDFEQWLRTVRPVVPSAGPTPEEECRAYLADLQASGPKRKGKAAYRHEAMKAIPNLSQRTFDRLWDELIRPDWRRPGPIKLPKKS